MDFEVVCCPKVSYMRDRGHNEVSDMISNMWDTLNSLVENDRGLVIYGTGRTTRDLLCIVNRPMTRSIELNENQFKNLRNECLTSPFRLEDW